MVRLTRSRAARDRRGSYRVNQHDPGDGDKNQVEGEESEGRNKLKMKTSQYEVTTAGNVLLIEADSHAEAKAIAEKEGHRVLASANSEYVNDVKIYDEKGYAEACE